MSDVWIVDVLRLNDVLVFPDRVNLPPELVLDAETAPDTVESGFSMEATRVTISTEVNSMNLGCPVAVEVFELEVCVENLFTGPPNTSNDPEMDRREAATRPFIVMRIGK